MHSGENIVINQSFKRPNDSRRKTFAIPYHKISISSAWVFKYNICSLRFSARFIRDNLALVSNDLFFSRGIMNIIVKISTLAIDDGFRSANNHLNHYLVIVKTNRKKSVATSSFTRKIRITFDILLRFIAFWT